MFFNRFGPNSQGEILFDYDEDWQSQISFYNSFKDTFWGGLGGRGFELTTSRVDFSSFSTDLTQIRKVGFFLAQMKIVQLFKPLRIE